MNISKIVGHQKEYFLLQETKQVSFRKNALKKLREVILLYESEINQALYDDFKKSEFESYATEIGVVLAELDLAIKKLNSWAKPKTVLPSMLNFPSWSKIYKEPYGTILIIAPWNYPFQLAISPLIGAIAAGNTAVIKPSELTPNTSKIVKKIITSIFKPNYVIAIEGGVEVSQVLLEQRWDYIFFTGSVQVGKIIAQSAAKNLTPVTLELGGKSPCIIDASASIKLVAKRLVWGKFLNGGQTCIAPDYILIDQKVKDEFVKYFSIELKKAYGKNPKESSDFPRIVNKKNFERLSRMIDNQEVLLGGDTDMGDLYIAPTLINNPDLESPVMQEEIFGPILPLISYEKEEEIDKIIHHFEKPLAFYVFSNRNAFSKRLIQKFAFGGGVVNDSIVHFVNHRLPFGGVGHSGFGNYHGKNSFNAFTHQKGVTKRFNWLDAPTRYAPYKGKLGQVKFLLKYFS